MRRIALFVPGGLGHAGSGIHIPTLYCLIEHLSERFEIIAYSHRLHEKQPSTTRCGNATVRFLNVTRESDPFSRAFSFLKSFAADHNQRKFSVVHGMWGIPFGLYALISGTTLSLPSVVTLMGQDTASIPSIGYGDLRKQPRRGLSQWIWKKSTVLIVQSEYQLEQMKKHGLTRNDVHVIPHGVDTGFFEGRRNGARSKQVHFLSIGDKNPVKDPVTLLKAFALIARAVDCRLCMIGKDHLGGQLQSLADRLGISEKVEFCGFVPPFEIRSQLSRADVLFQTSLSEGGGAAILEAAASKVVICGTRVGLLSDFEKRQMAICADIGDYETLAERVLDLLGKSDLFENMRSRAHTWVKRRDANWTAERMAEIYKRLISQ